MLYSTTIVPSLAPAAAKLLLLKLPTAARHLAKWPRKKAASRPTTLPPVWRSSSSRANTHLAISQVWSSYARAKVCVRFAHLRGLEREAEKVPMYWLCCLLPPRSQPSWSLLPAIARRSANPNWNTMPCSPKRPCTTSPGRMWPWALLLENFSVSGTHHALSSVSKFTLPCF